MLGLILLAASLNAPPTPSPSPAPVVPIVHVVVHVPMSGTRLSAYQHELGQYGRVTDHIGGGTWTTSHDPAAPIVSEPVDHIEITTDLRTARSFLPTFLRLLRIEQNQTETLGEIFGGAYGAPEQTRTRIIVRLRTADATKTRLDQLHRIFANNGDGGDSSYTEDGVVTDYSGVRAADTGRIEATLQQNHFAFSTEQETFITDDAATR